MTGRNSVYMISVLAPDRSGIIAEASSVLYDLGGNLEALSQTIMQGWFTMLIRAAFPAEVTRERIEQALEAAGGFDVVVRSESESRGPIRMVGEPFIIYAIGEDKPGIVRGMACCCANKGVNIDDVWNEVRERSFITVFHVTVPRDVDVKDLRYDLDHAAATLGISITLQHQDIFTATNSLQVHTRRVATGNRS